MTGRTAERKIETVRIVPDGSPVANHAFDVTPAWLVSGLITERGMLQANCEALARVFPGWARGSWKSTPDRRRSTFDKNFDPF